VKPINSAAKVYYTSLLSPKGKKFTKIENLAKFAAKHNLCNKHLSEVIQGKRIHHKGWVLEENKEYCGVEKIPMSNETKEKISKANMGKKHSKETLKKLRNQKIGTKNPNFGKRMLSKTKKALIKANTGRRMPKHVANSLIESRQKTYDIKIKDPNGNVYGPITNLSKFCRKHNLERSLLIKVFQGKRRHHKSWVLVE